jgi:hypothetical protein
MGRETLLSDLPTALTPAPPVENGDELVDTVPDLKPSLLEIKQVFGVPKPDNFEDYSSEVAMRLDLSTLDQVEELEEKVAGASMQIKGWKPPPRISTQEHYTFKASCDRSISDSGEKDERINPVDCARERLLILEAAIERRYIKAPLGQRLASCNSILD